MLIFLKVKDVKYNVHVSASMVILKFNGDNSHQCLNAC
jgi:hypothetical protein